MHADVSQIGRAAGAAPTPGGAALDLDAIAALARAATPGARRVDTSLDGGAWAIVADDGVRLAIVRRWSPAADDPDAVRVDADAAYIAAMSPDVALALVARVRELEAENARLRADSARLDAAQRHEWAMIPQVGGGWVFEGSYPMSESGDCDTYTAVRTRADLRAAIDAALATEAPDHA